MRTAITKLRGIQMIDKTILKFFAIAVLSCSGLSQANSLEKLEKDFLNPPAETRPWVFWHWTNGNVKKKGITEDLEAMKEVGIGGVITFRISGKQWAPDGPLKAGMKNQQAMIEYAAREAKRLGIEFSLVVDYGYGSGGPHITPDLSMQHIYRTEKKIKGGQMISVKLPKPDLKKIQAQGMSKAGFRAGSTFDPVVIDGLDKVDSYRDIAILALPTASAPGIASIDKYNGINYQGVTELKSKGVPIKSSEVIDLSPYLKNGDQLEWQAPEGDWTILRLGYASNFKFTRPCPAPNVGLECDRLHPRGIDQHFDRQLKPLLESFKGEQLIDYIFIDSWEARSQNWTLDFDKNFSKRNGYSIKPWLPVLSGHVVESIEKSERFLWDFRMTIGESMLENYIDRLEARLKPYGTQLIFEPFGSMCVDSLTWSGHGAFPVGEFWDNSERSIPETPGLPTDINEKEWKASLRAMSSIANTYGKPRVSAESFTGGRGWGDHPYLIKAMGDHAFCEGLSHIIFHVYVHQAYENMKPGLTHRKWGQHINRHQTWWNYSKPYMTYLRRCQTMLQQGVRVADVATLMNEGAPFFLRKKNFTPPLGYDRDLCTPEIIQKMAVRNGRITLPTGASYRYLEVIPSQLTLETVKKIESLRLAGAKVFKHEKIESSPSLRHYPQSDKEISNITRKWPLLKDMDLQQLFKKDGLLPDFEADGLRWVHRRDKETDIYFVSNPKYEKQTKNCIFRVSGKKAELWNAETGERHLAPLKELGDGRCSLEIDFEPAASCFVIFRDETTAAEEVRTPSLVEKVNIGGPWQLKFDPKWGSDQVKEISELKSWSEDEDPLVRYFSGTATYETHFNLKEQSGRTTYLDLGQVEVMGRVYLNGKDLGIVWKAPYRVDASKALIKGQNHLKIEIVNTWVNRLIGDEQLPLDSNWGNSQTMLEWPQWFLENKKRPSGRYTFTSVRHYKKNSALQVSGLLGPVRLLEELFQ